MRKVFVAFLLILIILTNSCSNKEENVTRDIPYESGVYHEKNWDEIKYKYRGGDVIPTKEVAINVAVQIFDGMRKIDREIYYEPQKVFFDEEDEIWIVTFYEPGNPNGPTWLGGSYYIAIRKNDGKVMCIWGTENV